MPFFSSIVVIVAVVTLRRISNTSVAHCLASSRKIHAGLMPSRSSRRRSQATNGTDSSTIQALPTTWPGQEIERAEGEPQKHDRSRRPDRRSSRRRRRRRAAGAPAAYRRRDRRIPTAERRRRSEHERRPAPTAPTGRCRTGSPSADMAGAKPPLHQVAQHQRDADHHHARRRHQAGRDRHHARPVRRNAGGADMADQPIGRRNGQREQDEKNRAFAHALLLPVRHHDAAFHLAYPSARNRQAGHSPQPKPQACRCSRSPR